MKGIKIALLVQELLNWLVLHWEGSAPAACVAGLFYVKQEDMTATLANI